MSQNKKNGAYILGNHRIYFMQIYAINEKRCQINFSHDIIVDFVAFKKERNHPILLCEHLLQIAIRSDRPVAQYSC